MKDNNTADDKILETIPLHNKDWWCKVEGGCIGNLKGKRKNKIPFDYDSLRDLVKNYLAEIKNKLLLKNAYKL